MALNFLTNRILQVALLAGLIFPGLGLAEVQWRTGASPRSAMTPDERWVTISDPAARRDARHIMLQFNRPLTAEDRSALNSAGVKVLSYLGDQAYFVAVDPNQVNRPVIERLALISDASELVTDWKLHPTFQRGERPTWAIVPARQQLPGTPKVWIAAYVLFHPDVDPVEARTALARHQAVNISELRSLNGAVIELPEDTVPQLAGEDAVQYLEPALPPMGSVNDSNRTITEADIAQAPPYDLDGSGVDVLVYDGGTARATHMDFGGRLTARDTSPLSNHATHVSGTIGGDGAASGGAWRGMAPGVTIESYGFEQVGGLQPGFLYTDPGDLEADYTDAVNLHGAVLANNSIGTNTAPNGFPCTWEGDYGVTSALIDSIVRGSLGAPIRIVWANGNERSSGRCGTTYHTTAPPACAKNHITVGALNSDDDSVTFFTSWGPADDGRLKPDVSAPGCQSGGDGGVTSSSSASDTAYTTFCGTSMAAPTVTGLSALLLQDYRVQHPGAPDFPNATLKALLAHNAEDIEALGPDYKTGYGSVRIQRTIDFMRSGSFVEAAVDQATTHTLLVLVDAADPRFKVTIAWDDPPGTPNVDPALVNDLDLRVFDPAGVQHFPWTLGGLVDPAAPAVRTQADHVNNIEQVLVESPAAGVWRVEIHGFNVPQGPQEFSACVSPRFTPDCNLNGVDDLLDVSGGTSMDCNSNSVPDECERPDDCNVNGVADICDIFTDTSQDVNNNSIADECETDCNGNSVPDDHDLAVGSSPDCNNNNVPDECDIVAGTSADCDGSTIPDECETDCNNNNVSDQCDITFGSSPDCNANGQPDECESDCNGNGIADECDITAGTSQDANTNGFPDECGLLYVDQGAVGAGSGSSWSNAFTDVQDALTHASGNNDVAEIRVAVGKYLPGNAGDFNASFQLLSGLKLIGGYAGSGNPPNPDLRDVTLYETILSGDIDLDDDPDGTMHGDNVFHVVTSGGTDATAVLDGFTIVGGSTNYGYHVDPVGSLGGGIYNVNGDPTIRNCTIKRNVGSHGSGMYNSGSSPTLINCTFTLNSVHLNQGAGMYNTDSGHPVVIDCTFNGNTLRGAFSQGAGAAIANRPGCSLTVTGTTFINNYADAFWPTGDDSGTYAGAIYHFGDALTVTNCTFFGNRSNQGGAIATWRDATITNCLFVNNRAPAYDSPVGGWGGFGGAVVGLSTAVLTVSGCTFVNNTAEDTGGLVGAGVADNCIFWGNSDNKGAIGTSQVSGFAISHCAIQNMLVGEPGEDPPSPANFPNSIDLDPDFVNQAAGDYRLGAGSPCIDAGDNVSVPAGEIRDLDGRPRFLDDPATPDTGGGIAPIVDIGAYEYGVLTDGDWDGDGDVDLVDYAAWTACVTGPGGGPVSISCDPFDFDKDTDVDLRDADEFQLVFDGGSPPLNPPAEITGAVSFGGAAVGTIHVIATGIGSGQTMFETTLAAAGPYTIDVHQAAQFNVSAYMDTNGNGQVDVDEPASQYPSNPISITSAGEMIIGVDISLGGSSGISGRIAYQSGSGAFNITVLLSGAATDSTTSVSGGNYSFTDLGDGSYLVTPSSLTRYFYPFDVAVDLLGADATGVDFEIHNLPSGEVDGEETGIVTAVDVAGYNLTLDVAGSPLTLFVYAGTTISGDANTWDEIQVGWNVQAQFYTSTGLAVELDGEP